MTNRFFNSNEDLKKQFRKLVKELHPDHGGNAEDFKAMMKEYEDIKIHGFRVQAQAEDIILSEAVKEALRKVVTLEDVEIELVGTWIWLSGNTYQFKDIIKDAGFKWAAKRKRWYFAEEKAKGKFKGDFEELKKHHGFQTIQNMHVEKIA